jgi:predicted ABC-type ATPase
VAQKRLRIFAGPNGSGKSSMLKMVENEVPIGCYINADKIEKLISDKKEIDFATYGIQTDSKTLYNYFSKSDFVRNKSDAEKLKDLFTVERNKIRVKDGEEITPKYAAAIIAEFLREENLKAGNDFSFETVMSHGSKIDFMKKANKKGYHCYLYFICTDDVRVNIERIKNRVKLGGHHVPEVKVRERYIRTLGLLVNALKACYKSYLFDNSDKTIEIARINRDGSLNFSVDDFQLPNWFKEYVLRHTR